MVTCTAKVLHECFISHVITLCLQRAYDSADFLQDLLTFFCIIVVYIPTVTVAIC